MQISCATCVELFRFPEHLPGVGLAETLPSLFAVAWEVESVDDATVLVDSECIFTAAHDLILAVALELEDAR